MANQDIYTREEERQKTIAAWLTSHEVMRKGKTLRKLRAGYPARRAARRSTHESWMADVRREPSKRWPHPFYEAA